jgi:DNA-binding NtrC family response regulator
MKKPRLLLVDDDPLIAESLAFALQAEFDVSLAQDRNSAVERLRAGLAPELALIDLGLPPVPHLPNEGFKLIGDLLAHVPDVRILVLTGQNEESNARRARALGAAISPSLVEPTLFGYAKGAFTGAQSAKSGYFEDAGEGTLFLDEIGELPTELQAKLLRVLENGEYQRVGETQTRVSRARIVAATNRDLREEVSRGRFRSDLYHRLSVFELGVPALRELGDDRLKLLDHYRQLYAAKAGSQPFELDPAARARWLAYPFPGNVRELKNIVIRLTTKYAGYTVGEAELDPEFAPLGEALRPDPLVQARAELTSGKPFNLDATLRTLEQAYLDAAIEIAQGNMSQAAKLLGISRGTLYGRLESAGKSGAKINLPEGSR